MYWQLDRSTAHPVVVLRCLALDLFSENTFRLAIGTRAGDDISSLVWLGKSISQFAHVEEYNGSLRRLTKRNDSSSRLSITPSIPSTTLWPGVFRAHNVTFSAGSAAWLMCMELLGLDYIAVSPHAGRHRLAKRWAMYSTQMLSCLTQGCLGTDAAVQSWSFFSRLAAFCKTDPRPSGRGESINETFLVVDQIEVEARKPDVFRVSLMAGAQLATRLGKELNRFLGRVPVAVIFVFCAGQEEFLSCWSWKLRMCASSRDRGW
ncbi:hypothetical protein C8R45DRAFT_1188066 [Mycena sanguinolenta]|nr:hypothetical protein C8R45DRAFT_1188066 [Mycena sanguinolenta]